MLHKILRTLITMLGIVIGLAFVFLFYGVADSFFMINYYTGFSGSTNFLIFCASGLFFGLIFFIISSKMANFIEAKMRSFEDRLSELPRKVVLGGLLGFVGGMIVAYLFTLITGVIPIPWAIMPINIMLYLICGYLGLRVGVKLFSSYKAGKASSRSAKKYKSSGSYVFAPKILDTSVIIDGRIFDICKTGVFEGTLVIPEFVLGELQHIADSSDSLKRTKGRRGLDLISRMQKELSIPIEITDRDYKNTETDTKLLKLCKEIGGKVITNDFNLNKVAIVQGISVFNINDLANAVKPVLLPDEEFTVTIIKEGKEQGQGVAYLDDGTMIVVEGGKKRLGETLPVTVTSALQTSAGRMIFAKIN